MAVTASQSAASSAASGVAAGLAAGNVVVAGLGVLGSMATVAVVVGGAVVLAIGFRGPRSVIETGLDVVTGEYCADVLAPSVLTGLASIDFVGVPDLLDREQATQVSDAFREAYNDAYGCDSDFSRLSLTCEIPCNEANEDCCAWETTDFGRVMRCPFQCTVHCEGCSSFEPFFDTGLTITGDEPPPLEIIRAAVPSSGSTETEGVKCDRQCEVALRVRDATCSSLDLPAGRRCFASEISSYDVAQQKELVRVVLEDPDSIPMSSDATSSPTTDATSSPTTISSTSPSSNPSGTPSLAPSTKPSETAFPTADFSPSAAPSVEYSQLPTMSPSATDSEAPSAADSELPTGKPSNLPSYSPSVSLEPSSSGSISPTLSPGPSVAASEIPTTTPSASPVGLASVEPSAAASETPTATPSVAPIGAASVEPSVAASEIPTTTPSVAPVVVISVEPSVAASEFPTAGPTATGSLGPTTLPSMDGSEFPTGDVSVVPTASGSEIPTFLPTNLASSEPTLGPTASFSAVPSNAPTLRPSESPSVEGSGVPTSLPSAVPSVPPSAVPSASQNPTRSVPTMVPSEVPSLTSMPTMEPTGVNSVSPSTSPTSNPSEMPSLEISDLPTTSPSLTPSISNSSLPSVSPSHVPSAVPSISPSLDPTVSPSRVPSLAPSESPSNIPSTAPSVTPSLEPSLVPSVAPSTVPSVFPSDFPSVSSRPSRSVPTKGPSAAPSFSPAPSLAPSPIVSKNPSALPTSFPSDLPSSKPSSQPSALDSSSPSVAPSAMPSIKDSETPSTFPSFPPSGTPSGTPSLPPTTGPTISPSHMPSALPTSPPSVIPSLLPSEVPSSPPSRFPSAYPSLSSRPSREDPTLVPSAVPSFSPAPSYEPSRIMSEAPSGRPSTTPTVAPTTSDSELPSRAPSPVPSGLPSTSLPSGVPSIVPSAPPSNPPSEAACPPPGGTDAVFTLVVEGDERSIVPVRNMTNGTEVIYLDELGKLLSVNVIVDDWVDTMFLELDNSHAVLERNAPFYLGSNPGGQFRKVRQMAVVGEHILYATPICEDGERGDAITFLFETVEVQPSLSPTLSPTESMAPTSTCGGSIVFDLVRLDGERKEIAEDGRFEDVSSGASFFLPDIIQEVGDSLSFEIIVSREVVGLDLTLSRDGVIVVNRTEGGPPYFLRNDFLDVIFPVSELNDEGSFVLTAIPDCGGGLLGAPSDVSFTFSYPPPTLSPSQAPTLRCPPEDQGEVTFILVQQAPGGRVAPIRIMQNNTEVIDLSVDGDQLSIMVEMADWVDRVVFELEDGFRNLESNVPFLMGANPDGEFIPVPNITVPGPHELRLRPRCASGDDIVRGDDVYFYFSTVSTMPSGAPSFVPSASSQPTSSLSGAPSAQPSGSPWPSPSPSSEPTTPPSKAPSAVPSAMPTGCDRGRDYTVSLTLIFLNESNFSYETLDLPLTNGTSYVLSEFTDGEAIGGLSALIEISPIPDRVQLRLDGEAGHRVVESNPPFYLGRNNEDGSINPVEILGEYGEFNREFSVRPACETGPYGDIIGINVTINNDVVNRPTSMPSGSPTVTEIPSAGPSVLPTISESPSAATSDKPSSVPTFVPAFTLVRLATDCTEERYDCSGGRGGRFRSICHVAASGEKNDLCMPDGGFDAHLGGGHEDDYCGCCDGSPTDLDGSCPDRR